jgi:hypothetical protein
MMPVRNHILEHDLPPRTNRFFFEHLASSLEVMDTRNKTANLPALNARIKEMAFYGVYPPVQWLSNLCQSKEDDDVRVSIIFCSIKPSDLRPAAS